MFSTVFKINKGGKKAIHIHSLLLEEVLNFLLGSEELRISWGSLGSSLTFEEFEKMQTWLGYAWFPLSALNWHHSNRYSEWEKVFWEPYKVEYPCNEYPWKPKYIKQKFQFVWICITMRYLEMSIYEWTVQVSSFGRKWFQLENKKQNKKTV